MPRQSAIRGAPPIWTQQVAPRRPRALGTDEIVAAATALADEGGPDAITMKAVAARLGPYTPMALYRYVHSKEGLIDLMLDAAIATVDVPERPGSDWRADLASTATATRQMIKAHPWYAALVHTRPPAGPHTMRRTEFMLEVLVGRGASLEDAMTYAALIDRHVFGSGLQEAEEARFFAREGVDSGEKLVAAIRSLHDLAVANGRVPLLANWLAHPSAGSVDEQFELGLGFLLDGIAGRLPRRRSR
ncbi:MAG TPA: TetR/AcrR family transcriptional regulator [Micromonosporaceae bacterium]